jgi:SAM-dependent methyltransferase
MNRKQRRALRHGGTAVSDRASGAGPAAALADLFNTGVAHHRAGALIEAERCYRQMLAIAPTHAEAHSRLGAVLMGQGRTHEAIAFLERAAALNPGLFEAHANLAQAYSWTGQREGAIEAAARALELNETPHTKTMFAQCVAFARFTADDKRFRRFLLRALTEGWARPRDLTAACLSLVAHNPLIRNGIARAGAAWPERLAAGEGFGPTDLAALSHDRLLCGVLECDPVTDVGFERLLTNVRRALLASATADASIAEDALSFYCSVARQCFINEYVFSVTDSETEAANRLRQRLETTLADGGTYSALWPVAVGAYFPLHTLPNAQALTERTWPQCVKSLLVQQVEEPAQERAIAARIPALTAIDSEVSRAVRQQYEENPYPRWVKLSASGPVGIPIGREAQELREVLIAGCGTGLSATEFARLAPKAHVTAIDLSLASLGYGARMAKKFGLTNIEFQQADITRLGSIGQQFDFIDASGVLHHLADPWEGWRILLSLLRPGCAMQVGLYSEPARRRVVAARALIAERGYRPVPQDIRRLREEITASPDPLLKSLSGGADFFTTSECRDLLFHVEEHRTTLPEIKSFLAANRLQFAGFYLDALTQHAFAMRFPQPGAVTDLDRWHVFETEAPATFAAMYQFSVRKPA